MSAAPDYSHLPADVAQHLENKRNGKGAPPKWTQEELDVIGLIICDRIGDGESVRQVLADPNMPDSATLSKWCTDPQCRKPENFVRNYAQARERQSDALAEDVMNIPDSMDRNINDTFQHMLDDLEESGEEVTIAKIRALEKLAKRECVEVAKLRMDARKWIASHQTPQRWGTQLSLMVNGEIGISGIAPKFDYEALSEGEIESILLIEQKCVIDVEGGAVEEPKLIEGERVS